MNKYIKRLQKQLADGKIDLAEYKEQLQELLDDKLIEQKDFDDAKDFEPEGDDDKPIYSQTDFDRSLVIKARKMVKKALTDAGVDLDGVDNKDLLKTFGDLALQGQNKGGLTVDEKEVNDLKKKAKAFDELQPQVKTLSLENAVLKAAGQYKFINPKQVVRALEDYKEFLEYDEDDVLLPKSVDRALKELVKAEPNLLKTAGDEDLDEDDDLDEDQNKGGFQGKPPGGGAGGSQKAATKQAKLKSEALEMLGLGKKEN